MVAFGIALAQQLPPSPHGSYAFKVQPTWRDGTKVVFKAKDGDGRPVAFELRERRHPKLSRRAPLSSGDLLWRGSCRREQAARGTRLRVHDLAGAVHSVELIMSAEEAAGHVDRVVRRVGTGLGMLRKGGGRGDLFAEVKLLGGSTATMGLASAA